MSGSILRHIRTEPQSVAEWAIVPLRLIIGFGFMAHGYAKLARGPEHFTGILNALGVPVPALLSSATILVELAGGLAVLLGAYVPLTSIPMAIVLIVAIVTVHLPNGFSSIKLESMGASGPHFGQPGYETDLLYLAGLFALAIRGPGPLSVGGFRRLRLRPDRHGEASPLLRRGPGG